MRPIVFSVFLCLASLGIAQTPALQAPVTAAQQSRDLRGTDKSPLIVAPIEIRSAPPAPDRRGTSQQPLILDPITVGPITVAKSPEEENHERWKFRFDFALAFGTVLLAVSTFLLWMATYRLAKEAKETSERQAGETTDALGIAVKAANAAEESAKATAQTASVMEETAQRQLRAYLAIFPNRLYNFIPGKVPTVDFGIVNDGLTPARDVVTYGLIDICPHPLPHGYQLPELIRESATFVVHPRSPMNGVTRAGKAFNEEDMRKAIDGTEYRVYIFAQVRYEDVYEHARSTTICTHVDSLEKLKNLMDGASPEFEKLYFAWADQLNQAD